MPNFDTRSLFSRFVMRLQLNFFFDRHKIIFILRCCFLGFFYLTSFTTPAQQQQHHIFSSFNTFKSFRSLGFNHGFHCFAYLRIENVSGSINRQNKSRTCTQAYSYVVSILYVLRKHSTKRYTRWKNRRWLLFRLK